MFIWMSKVGSITLNKGICTSTSLGFSLAYFEYQFYSEFQSNTDQLHGLSVSCWGLISRTQKSGKVLLLPLRDRELRECSYKELIWISKNLIQN